MMLRLAPEPATARVAWDDAPCPLCGRRDDELVLEAPDNNPGDQPPMRFAVVRCRSCSLHYTNPRPAESSIGRFYPADYLPHHRRKPGNTGREPVLDWVGRGRLLDFGCGGGRYLRRMADRGWTVTGLDPAAGAVRHVREDQGLRALIGSLPHPELRPCSFDAVTMWHSLEHVHRPLTVLREAYRLLVPGGRLAVACPNVAGWPFRAFGPNWFGLDLPRHLVHFTPRTLADILTAAGFRVTGIRQDRHSDWLRSSAKLAVRAGVGGWRSALTWKPLAKFAAWVNYEGGANDCMTAFAVRPE